MHGDLPGRFLSRLAQPGARRTRRAEDPADPEPPSDEPGEDDAYAFDEFGALTVERELNRTKIEGVLHYPVAAVVVGPDMGTFVDFARTDVILIGRDPAAGLLLKDPGASRKHAQITWKQEDHRFLVQDLGSTNGVQIQDVQVDEVVVAPGTAIVISDNTIMLDLWTAETIDHQEKVNAKMQEVEGRDPLTRLSTRLFLDEQLPALVDFYRKERHRLCCLFLDLDHFKTLNDTYGHQVGDSVLKQVGHLVVQACRQEDCWVRFGGEELLGFMPNTDEETAWMAAERVRTYIEQYNWSLIRPDLRVTCSIGTSRLRPGEPVDSWIGRADEALYLAKRNGRNRVERSD